MITQVIKTENTNLCQAQEPLYKAFIMGNFMGKIQPLTDTRPVCNICIKSY